MVFFSARFKDCDIFYVCVFVLFRSSIWLIYRCFLSLSAFSHSLLFSVRFIFLLFFFSSLGVMFLHLAHLFITLTEREKRKKTLTRNKKIKCKDLVFCVVLLFCFWGMDFFCNVLKIVNKKQRSLYEWRETIDVEMNVKQASKRERERENDSKFYGKSNPTINTKLSNTNIYNK